jgi:hypothetical protein
VSTSYEADVVAWANEQARLIRAGRFDLLDLEHLAEEIEDVGKSEQRELASRMAVLLAHLLKWQFQPERRSASWSRTIKEQRERITLALRRTPSLKATLEAPDWQREMWLDSLDISRRETGLDLLLDECPWPMVHVLDTDFFPRES